LLGGVDNEQNKIGRLDPFNNTVFTVDAGRASVPGGTQTGSALKSGHEVRFPPRDNLNRSERGMPWKIEFPAADAYAERFP